MKRDENEYYGGPSHSSILSITCFLQREKKHVFSSGASEEGHNKSERGTCVLCSRFEQTLIVKCDFLINFTWGCSHDNAT